MSSAVVWCFQLCLGAEASSGNLTERAAAGSEYSLNVYFFSVVDNINKVRVMGHVCVFPEYCDGSALASTQSWWRPPLGWPGYQGRYSASAEDRLSHLQGIDNGHDEAYFSVFFRPSVLLPNGDPELAGAAAGEVPEELGGGQDVALLARHPPLRPAQPSA